MSDWKYVPLSQGSRLEADRKAAEKAARLVAEDTAGLRRKKILIHPDLTDSLADVAETMLEVPHGHVAYIVEELQKLLKTRMAKYRREAAAEKRFIARKKKLGAM